MADSIPWTSLLDSANKAEVGWTDGTFMAEAEAVELKQASTGKQMVVIKFRFVGGPLDGKKLTRNFVIVPDRKSVV